MSRSVTKLALAVSVPMITLATLSVLGSHPKHASVPGSAAQAVRYLAPGHTAPNVRHLAQVAPTPIPVAAAPVAAPPAPAAVAQRPVAPRPARKPLPPPVRGVGGAAGAEFSLVNQDRAANGIAGLAWSASLARVAQYRAQDMLNRNYFSHYDPATGQLAFVQLMRLWGIPYSTAGENIAWSTNPSMAAINTMFMNSPEHRANILKAGYHRVGIGVASNGAKVMVVEVFSN